MLNRRKLLLNRRKLLLLLLWLAGSAAGCFAGDGDFAHRVRMEYETANDTVVATDHGTACAIGPHTLVTAAHVITPTAGRGQHTKIYIEHEIGWLRCEVTKIDTVNDICILECKSVELPYIHVDATLHKAGEYVTLWSSILGAKVASLRGTLTKFIEGKHQFWCDTNGFDHGGSGSPVVADNKLVGVAVAGRADGRGGMAHDTAFVVPAKAIENLIAGAPEIITVEDHAPRAIVNSAIPAPEWSRPQVPPRYASTEALAPKCRTCHAVSDTPTCRSCVHSARHWDSDADGHGQGGWVED